MYLSAPEVISLDFFSGEGNGERFRYSCNAARVIRAIPKKKAPIAIPFSKNRIFEKPLAWGQQVNADQQELGDYVGGSFAISFHGKCLRILVPSPRIGGKKIPDDRYGWIDCRLNLRGYQT